MKAIYISLVLVLLFGCGKQEKVVDWSPYFESQYKTPLGTEVFRKELKHFFNNAEIKNITGSTDEYIKDKRYINTTFMYVNTRYFPSQLESTNLLKFAKKENSLFMASYFNGNYLLKKLGVNTESKTVDKYVATLDFLRPNKKQFNIENRFSTVHYFNKIPANAKILGYLKMDSFYRPNFIQLTLKNNVGNIYLHANPELFSNYYMLNEADGLYALNTLNYIKHQNTILWDGNGTERRYTSQPSKGGIAETLRFVFGSKPLSAAFFLALASILLFVAFNYKRIVRPIPIHKSLNNNSLAFTKLVGNLFMDQENHIDIARYRVIYLLDNVKRKFNLDTSELDEVFTYKLAEKADVNEEELKPFVRLLNKIKNNSYLCKDEFMSLNKHVELFSKKLKINQWKT